MNGHKDEGVDFFGFSKKHRYPMYVRLYIGIGIGIAIDFDPDFDYSNGDKSGLLRGHKWLFKESPADHQCPWTLGADTKSTLPAAKAATASRTVPATSPATLIRAAARVLKALGPQ